MDSSCPADSLVSTVTPGAIMTMKSIETDRPVDRLLRVRPPAIYFVVSLGKNR